MDMTVKYKVKYKETMEFLTAYCKLYNLDRQRYTSTIVVAILGPLALWICYRGGFVGGGTMQETLLFYVKFIVAWAAAFGLGIVITKLIGKPMALNASLGDAEQVYKVKMKNRKDMGPLEVTVEFLEEGFVIVSPGKRENHAYADVVRLIESPEAMGIVAYIKKGGKGLFCFPQKGLVDADPEDFRKFLLEHCPNVKKGFLKIDYKPNKK